MLFEVLLILMLGINFVRFAVGVLGIWIALRFGIAAMVVLALLCEIQGNLALL